MHPETDKSFGELKDLNADSPKDRQFWNIPFLWDSEQKGGFIIQKFLVNEGFIYSAVPPIGKLEDCRCYTISLWESGYTYYLGRTQTGDWMGFKMNSWHEYNP